MAIKIAITGKSENNRMVGVIPNFTETSSSIKKEIPDMMASPFCTGYFLPMLMFRNSFIIAAIITTIIVKYDCVFHRKHTIIMIPKITPLAVRIRKFFIDKFSLGMYYSAVAGTGVSSFSSLARGPKMRSISSVKITSLDKSNSASSVNPAILSLRMAMACS